MIRSVTSGALTLCLLVTVFLLTGCADQQPYGQEPNLIDGEPAPLTAEVLKNATYDSEHVKAGRAQLKDGVYEEQIAPDSASKNTLMLTEHIAFGDVNGDPIDDAAVVLAASGGGSGTFRSLEAVVNEDGAPVHVASILLGDRVQIEELIIADQYIKVQMLTHAQGDGMCCPTLRVVQLYQLDDGELQLRHREEKGKVGDSE